MEPQRDLSAIMFTVKRSAALFSEVYYNIMLWEMMILGHYKLSFLERLSSSQRVLYVNHSLYNNYYYVVLVAVIPGHESSSDPSEHSE